MMDLQTARQIIQEQADYLKTTTFHMYQNDYAGSIDSVDIDEVVVSDINMTDYGIDPTKIHVDIAAKFGGEEGDGELTYSVYKIDHPVHGVGHIMYYGEYVPWLGVTPIGVKMVTGVEKTVIDWVDA